MPDWYFHLDVVAGFWDTSYDSDVGFPKLYMNHTIRSDAVLMPNAWPTMFSDLPKTDIGLNCPTSNLKRNTLPFRQGGSAFCRSGTVTPHRNRHRLRGGSSEIRLQGRRKIPAWLAWPKKPSDPTAFTSCGHGPSASSRFSNGSALLDLPEQPLRIKRTVSNGTLCFGSDSVLFPHQEIEEREECRTGRP